MTDDRPRIARTGELFSRETVHQSAEGLDVLSSQAFTIHERRLLYDDVQLVTLHVDRGVAYLITTGVFGFFLVALSIFIVAMNTKMYLGALPFFILGLPAVFAFFMRLAVGREVVTVHGRRSKAVLRFGGFQKKKARAVYGQICSLVRRAQQPAGTNFESPSPLARGEGAEGG
jgi:hypothetical protein